MFYVETMKNDFVDISICGELNYRLFLSVIKHELDKLGYADIAAVQALILMNLGDNVVTITEVMSRGYYIGSNASYNIISLKVHRIMTSGLSCFRQPRRGRSFV